MAAQLSAVTDSQRLVEDSGFTLDGSVWFLAFRSCASTSFSVATPGEDPSTA